MREDRAFVFLHALLKSDMTWEAVISRDTQIATSLIDTVIDSAVGLDYKSASVKLIQQAKKKWPFLIVLEPNDETAGSQNQTG